MTFRMIRNWLLTLSSVFLLAACGDGKDLPGGVTSEPASPLSYQLSLTPTLGQVAIGKTLALIATLTDNQGRTISNPSVTFASSDPAAASVTNDGLVTGIKAGTVTVTAHVTAPDGSALSQHTVLTVLGPALTYNLALTHPTLNLQYNQPTTTTAALLRSDGSDVTAQATGWTWTSSDSSAVSTVSMGSSATLTAHNTSANTSAAANIVIRAIAPDGSVVSGQIAATALPNYTYQINLSTSVARIATDRSETISARVIRSDGADVTSQFTNWNWSWPPYPVPGAVFIRLSTSSDGAVATFSSVVPSGRGTFGAAFTNTVTVSADGPAGTTPAPPASLSLAQYRAYSVITNFPTGTVNSPILLTAQVVHTSDDAQPDVTSQCAPQYWTPNGVTLSTTGNPDGQAFATAAAPGSFDATFECQLWINGIFYNLVTPIAIQVF